MEAKMYFDDLAKYTYFERDVNAINIGWLDSSKEFAKGDVPEEFL